jgi:hypothetical protein
MYGKHSKGKSRKNSTEIHPTSQKPGTGSGNLYNHVKKPAIDNENPPKTTGYGI